MIPNIQAKDLIDKLKINPFIDGPTQSLVKATAKIIADTPEFRYIFGENVDVYERDDYSFRQLPALRIYNKTYRKEQESHYIVGELELDVLYPADLRREELQYFQDVLSSALMQQFRRVSNFQTLRAMIPGLNELGKTFDVDKSLGLVVQDGACPITQMKANFRIDLKVWDAYLESTGRTKDDPFNVTLKDLKTIASQILPTRDDGSVDQSAAVNATVTIGG